MKEILLKHNFQWLNQQFETGIQREELTDVIKALQVRHVIAISGARRAGKSFLYKQIIFHLLQNNINSQNILQINFEDPFFLHFRNDSSIILF